MICVIAAFERARQDQFLHATLLNYKDTAKENYMLAAIISSYHMLDPVFSPSTELAGFRMVIVFTITMPYIMIIFHQVVCCQTELLIFYTYEVALKMVGHIAYYSANCCCIKHNLDLLACIIPKFW